MVLCRKLLRTFDEMRIRLKDLGILIQDLGELVTSPFLLFGRSTDRRDDLVDKAKQLGAALPN